MPLENKEEPVHVVEDLAEQLGEITLADIVRGHKSESTTTTDRKLQATLPTQFPFGLHNSTCIYCEALRSQFEPITDSSWDTSLRIQAGHASS
ncbi:unnamed protein product [Urochloa humidicola]